VIYGVYWLVRANARAKARRGAEAGGLTVVAAAGLGPNRTLQLVRIGDELVLVGVTETSVTPVRVYDARESAELLPRLETGDEQFFAGGASGFAGRAVDELRRRTARR
jgi:flagellar biogenesis protein FliO